MKKNLSILLCIAMVVLMLAGCGSTAASSAAEAASAETSAASAAEAPAAEEPAAEVPAEAEAASEAEPASAAEEASAVEEEVVEFEGVDYDLPLYEDTLEVSMFAPLRGGFPSKLEEGVYPFWDRLQENLNVAIEFVEPSQTAAQEQFNLMVSSGTMADIISESMVSRDGAAYAGGYDKGVEDDVYADLTDYIEECCPNFYGLINADDDAHRAAYTDEGRVVSFPTVNTEDSATNMGLCVNTEYMEATGLDVPNTIEGWSEVFAAMKSNGVKYCAYTTGEGAVMNGALANELGAEIEADFLLDAETNELTFGPITDESRAYIEQFREWFEAGYIDPDFININAMDNTPFNEGELATFNTMAQEIETYETNYGVAITPCPTVIPEGAEAGQIKLGVYGNSRVSDLPGITISADCQCIEEALKMIDWFYSPEGSKVCNYGWVEGELYDMVDGSPKINENYSSRDEATSQAMKSLYTADGDFGLVEPNISLQLADDFMIETTTETWYTDTSYPIAIYYTLPNAISLTADESESIGNTYADIETYVDGTILKWLTCAEELTDESWEAYVTTVQDMGLDEVQEVYSAAFERYVNK